MSENALGHWLDVLAVHHGARLTPVPGGWRVRGTQDRVVCSVPRSEDEWQHRFDLVEKAAASTLTNGPVTFAATLSPVSSKSSSRIVRLAFGLSFSFGHALRRRFTVYSPLRKGDCKVIAGDDAFFTRNPALGPLDLGQPGVREALERAGAAVAEAQQIYLRDPAVVAELDRIRKSFSDEVRCLERFYIPQDSFDTRILGHRAKNLGGDDAIEAEYLARLDDVLERYRPAILFEPLTIGVIEGWLPA